MTVMISSLDRRSVSAPRWRSNWLRRRTPPHFAGPPSPGHRPCACRVREALHPFVAVAVHEGVEPGASFRRPFDYDRVNDPGSDEPDEGGEVGKAEDGHRFRVAVSGNVALMGSRLQ